MEKSNFLKKSTKVMLSILIISFILSSISGLFYMLNRYTVLKIDNEKIDIKSFASLLGQERELAYQKGMFDIDYILSKDFIYLSLEKIKNKKLLEKYLNENNISYSKNHVLKEIINEESFFEDGKFDINKYRSFLDLYGTTEDKYIKLLRNQLAVNFLINILQNNEIYNKNIIEKIIEKKNNYKIVNLYRINENNISTEKISNTDEELKAYYNNNIRIFTVEEERKIDFVKIKLKEKETDTEDMIRNRVQKVNTLIIGNNSLEKIAGDFDTKVEKIGYVKLNSKNEELKISNKILFELKLNEKRTSFDNDFCYVYNISEIKDSYVKKFEDVKNEINDLLTQKKLHNIYLDRINENIKNKDFNKNYRITKNILIKNSDQDYPLDFIADIYDTEINNFTKIFFDKDFILFAFISGEKKIDKEDLNFISFEEQMGNFTDDQNEEIGSMYLKYLSKKYEVQSNYGLLDLIK